MKVFVLVVTTFFVTLQAVDGEVTIDVSEELSKAGKFDYHQYTIECPRETPGYDELTQKTILTRHSELKGVLKMIVEVIPPSETNKIIVENVEAFCTNTLFKKKNAQPREERRHCDRFSIR